MDNQQHILRRSYPDVFGKSSISGATKTWFVKTDWIPISIIVLLFAWLAWSSGHIEPVKKIHNLKSAIEKTNSYFDERAKKTIRLVDVLRERIAEHEMENFKVRPTDSKDGRKKALEYLDDIENNVARLTLKKPNNEVIEARLNAAIEFAELSTKIVKMRDLGQYDLNKGSQLANADKPKFGDKDWLITTFDELQTIDKHDIKIGSSADQAIAKGKLSINKAEQFLDELNEPESKAKALLEKFDGLAMPRREHELLSRILDEWNVQYSGLLTQWKLLRNIEISVNEVIAKKAEIIKKQESKKALKQAQSEQSNTSQNKSTSSKKTKQKQTTSKKSSTRESKLRKALDLLK